MNAISVIMLTYNRENYITVAIESVLKQTFTDYEFIIIDNGSVDRSGIIAEEYAHRDDRIKVIHIESKSIGAARNIGIQEAAGEYIAFIDDDDFVERDFLEFLYELVQSEDADISICGATELLMGELRPQCVSEERMVLTAQEAVFELLSRRRIRAGMPTKLIKRKILERFPFEEECRHEDIRTIYKYLSVANKVVVWGIPKYCFVRHGENISFFTSDNSRLTSEQIKEYLVAFKERTEYLRNTISCLGEYAQYCEWSYMISMIDKIEIYKLKECFDISDEMKRELCMHYDEFYHSSYLQEFEKENLKKYIV